MEWTSGKIAVTPDSNIVWWADIVASDDQWVAFSYYDSSDNFIRRDSWNYTTEIYTRTVTVPSNATSVRMSWRNYSNDDFTNRYLFTALQGLTTITIGSTVYGGEYDARTGVLTVTRIYIKPASTATISSFSHTANNTWIFVIQGFSAVTRGEAISNINIVDTYGNTTGNGFCKATTNYPVFSLNDADNNLNASSSAADIRTAFANFVNTYSPEAVYELATPQTIQLPPCPIDTLEGVNNIWADTGDTTLQYPKFG